MSSINFQPNIDNYVFPEEEVLEKKLTEKCMLYLRCNSYLKSVAKKLGGKTVSESFLSKNIDNIITNDLIERGRFSPRDIPDYSPLVKQLLLIGKKID